MKPSCRIEKKSCLMKPSCIQAKKGVSTGKEVHYLSNTKFKDLEFYLLAKNPKKNLEFQQAKKKANKS